MTKIVCKCRILLEFYTPVSGVSASLHNTEPYLTTVKNNNEFQINILSRGFWYERLCLDLENHLKKPKLALEKIELALQVEQIYSNSRRGGFLLF